MIKRIAFIFFVIFIASSVNAQVANLNEAQTQARSENKLILVKFSGSDWCGPCIMLKKSIYDTQELFHLPRKLIYSMPIFHVRKRINYQKNNRSGMINLQKNIIRMDFSLLWRCSMLTEMYSIPGMDTIRSWQFLTIYMR